MTDGLLRVGTFTPSVLIHLTRRSGRFRRAGIDVREYPVASSPAQFRSLEAGELDVAITSPDNVLAHRFLSKNPLRRNLPVSVIAAIDRGLGLALCTAPSVRSADDVRGGAVGVDVADSGFAFVAYALLEKRGLQVGDYRVDVLGSTPTRASALIDSRCAATVLGSGNELRAEAAGCSIVAEVTELGRYIGSVVAAMDTPDPQINDVRRRFADALLETAGEIVAGERGAEFVESAMALLELSESEAVGHYRRALAPSTGFIPDGFVDRESIMVLVELRRRYLATPELDRAEDHFLAMASA